MNHFVLGVLTATASKYGLIPVRELCRLAKLADSDLPAVLAEIRASLGPSEPDVTLVVVPSHGDIGLGRDDADGWRRAVRAAWHYWSEVRNED